MNVIFSVDFDERKFQKTFENMVLIRGISNFKLFIAFKFNNAYPIYYIIYYEIRYYT